MFKPDKRLSKLYHKYNRYFFDGELPSDVIVGWMDMEKGSSIGMCATYEEDEDAHHTVYISTELKRLSTIARMTLLHEMCHVKLHPYRFHGKKFNDEMLRLASRGAFIGLW